jgi:hypothetical protein
MQDYSLLKQIMKCYLIIIWKLVYLDTIKLLQIHVPKINIDEPNFERSV